jgi:hypothetical protein
MADKKETPKPTANTGKGKATTDARGALSIYRQTKEDLRKGK